MKKILKKIFLTISVLYFKSYCAEPIDNQVNIQIIPSKTSDGKPIKILRSTYKEFYYQITMHIEQGNQLSVESTFDTNCTNNDGNVLKMLTLPLINHNEYMTIKYLRSVINLQDYYKLSLDRKIPVRSPGKKENDEKNEEEQLA